MLKIIGSIIVLFSATMAGWQVGRYYAVRPVQLRAMLMALQMLETEIVFAATPLYRAFVKIGQRVQTDIGQIFLAAAELMLKEEGYGTAECWRQGIEQKWYRTALRKPEKEILLNLGYVLGSSDREDQQKHIRLTVAHLNNLEQEARVEQTKYEKMYKSLGFLGGLLVVILMF